MEHICIYVRACQHARANTQLFLCVIRFVTRAHGTRGSLLSCEIVKYINFCNLFQRAHDHKYCLNDVFHAGHESFHMCVAIRTRTMRHTAFALRMHVPVNYRKVEAHKFKMYLKIKFANMNLFLYTYCWRCFFLHSCGLWRLDFVCDCELESLLFARGRNLADILSGYR